MLSLAGPGIFCEAGGFHIDPMRAVKSAVITHAHSDHARTGSERYYCALPGVGLLQHRLGPKSKVIGVPYGEPFELGSARLSFHPAGHILGSAQVRIETVRGVWVVSGDYKRDEDPTCARFEPIPCDGFVSEATFGLPIYQWPDVSKVTAEIHAWWMMNRARGVNSVLQAYSLGKAQRVLGELLRYTREPVWTHTETSALTAHYRAEGVALIPTRDLSELHGSERLEGQLILTPSTSGLMPWRSRLGACETAFASGWMRVRAKRSRRGYQQGFIVSDHADWPGLIRSVKESGARKILIHHDSGDGALARYLREQGLDAQDLDTALPRSAG